MQDLYTLTDDQLVVSFSEGCNQAFDVLLTRHKDNVFAYIQRLVKDDEVTNDIFQETFVKAIIRLKQGKYATEGKFAAWLMRIAHNLVIDFFRQNRQLATVSTDNGEVNVLNRKDLSEGTAEDAIISVQTLEDVLHLVETLPADQRLVVEMRYYQELSFKEIAERTGVSINTALGRMRYAIMNMRRRARQTDLLPAT